MTEQALGNKKCINPKCHGVVPKTEYQCDNCGTNWEGDETGKWADHYFKKCEEMKAYLMHMPMCAKPQAKKWNREASCNCGLDKMMENF